MFQRLDELGKHHCLWCVTNASSYLQRRKLLLSGLDDFFAEVLVSGEIDSVKASATFVERASRRLMTQHEVAVRVIGASEESDGFLASSLGIPLQLVTPGSDFA